MTIVLPINLSLVLLVVVHFDTIPMRSELRSPFYLDGAHPQNVYSHISGLYQLSENRLPLEVLGCFKGTTATLEGCETAVSGVKL